MPSIAITRAYEAVYILSPDLGEEQIASITNRYKGVVASSGGQVQKIDVWERRKLAYEIKGRTEGIYVVMQFTAEAKAEAELRRVFQISEDQIRSMIVKLDEENAPPAAQAAPNVPAAQAAPAAEPTPAAEPVPVQPAAVEAQPTVETDETEPAAEPETAAAA